MLRREFDILTDDALVSVKTEKKCSIAEQVRDMFLAIIFSGLRGKIQKIILIRGTPREDELKEGIQKSSKCKERVIHSTDPGHQTTFTQLQIPKDLEDYFNKIEVEEHFIPLVTDETSDILRLNEWIQEKYLELDYKADTNTPITITIPNNAWVEQELTFTNVAS